MVAGDLVNTASRIQSRRRARHRLRRRGDPPRDRADDRVRGRRHVRAEGQGRPDAALAGAARRLRRARLAEVARPRGAVRRSRARAAPDQGSLPRLAPRTARPHLVSVTGIAGIGKSRLAWEFYKYFDGLAAAHVLAPRPLPRLRRGRHLLGARGHGPHALPDRRGRGAGARRSRSCARRSRSTCPTPRSGAFVEPRLAQLLGARRATSRASGRTCSPPGGSSSSASPTSTRPCSRSRTCSGRTRACSTSSSTCSSGRATRRSTWSRWLGPSCSSGGRPGAPATATSARSTSSRSRRRRWRSCSTGSFPGCRASVREQILARAEGVPLYAVETVRMLLDRGLLVQEGAGLPPGRRDRVARGARDAARADRRAPRRSLGRGAAAAPGRRRAREDVHAARRWRRLGGRSEDELEPLLAALVRKEVLGVQADPRSPEHGQYGFLQDLVRHVAYETLSKRGAPRAAPRRRRAPRGRVPGRDSEIVEVDRLALPRRLRRRPRMPTTRPGSSRRRASTLAACRRARSLARRRRGGASATSSRRPRSPTSRCEQAELLGTSRRHGRARGRSRGGAGRCYERSIAIYEAEGDTHAAARVSGRFASTLGFTGPPRRGARANGARVRGDRGRRAGRGPRSARRAAVPRLLVQR